MAIAMPTTTGMHAGRQTGMKAWAYIGTGIGMCSDSDGDDDNCDDDDDDDDDDCELG